MRMVNLQQHTKNPSKYKAARFRGNTSSMENVLFIEDYKKPFVEDQRRRNDTQTLRTRGALIDSLIASAYNDDYTQDGWDGYDAKKLDRKSIIFAHEFLNILPDNIILPDIDPNPNGLLGLYWSTSSNQLLLDISQIGIISFAHRSTDGSTHNGRINFLKSYPAVLFSLLKTYFEK